MADVNKPSAKLEMVEVRRRDVVCEVVQVVPNPIRWAAEGDTGSKEEVRCIARGAALCRTGYKGGPFTSVSKDGLGILAMSVHERYGKICEKGAEHKRQIWRMCERYGECIESVRDTGNLSQRQRQKGVSHGKGQDICPLHIAFVRFRESGPYLYPFSTLTTPAKISNSCETEVGWSGVMVSTEREGK
ncbi:hypothetical protein B0H19DRAFT_1064284 [Mycena capillaripes]|nr:hypothetical protein B0H19DRAFT_1064284 [Mycena capillaripes]